MTNEFINNMLEVDEAYRCAFGDHSNHPHPTVVVDEPEEDNSIFLVSEDAISKFEELDVLEQLLADGASFLFYEF